MEHSSIALKGINWRPLTEVHHFLLPIKPVFQPLTHLASYFLAAQVWGMINKVLRRTLKVLSAAGREGNISVQHRHL